MSTDPASVYKLFFNPGEVVEIRSFGLKGNSKLWEGRAWNKGTVMGFFDRVEEFGELARGLAKSDATAVYFTINPCDPALMARSNRRLVVSDKDRPATSDQHIQCIRWLMVDIDPKRVAKVSSTQAELDAARAVAKKTVTWLEQVLRFPPGIRAMSGNGYHVFYRLPDLPVGDEISGSGGLVSRALLALGQRFNTKHVDIDRTVYNPSRISKIYGTWARKGDSTDDRPHRESFLFDKGPECLADVGIVTRELLAELAGFYKEPGPSSPPATRAPAPGGTTRYMDNQLGAVDVGAYLSHYGVEVKAVKQRKDATWHLLETCLFNSDHRGGEAAIVQSSGIPPLTYSCFHNSCKGMTWKDARKAISGEEKIARFCAGYNPNWKPPKTPKGTTGICHSIEIAPQSVMTEANGLPSPRAVDPREFFEQRGKREVFVVTLLAKYLAAYLSPFVHTGGQFWRYENGVWRTFSETLLRQFIVEALGDLGQAPWIKHTRDMLAGTVNREEDAWPDQGTLVNVKNGMVDIKAVKLLPHSPDYGSRVQLPVNWDIDATCDRWVQFLEEVFPASPGKIMLLQQYFGYCFLDTCKFEKCLFMYGTGSNGKSTVLNMMEDIVGRECCTSLGLDALANRFSIPDLMNKMINVAAEIETREPRGTETLKKCISGDLISGEHKYGGRVDFHNRAKFIFAMNNPPNVADKSFGFKRKVLLLNFNRRFEESEMDRDLFKKLQTERDGVFMWACGGAYELISNGSFSTAADVDEDHNQFMTTLNPLMLYIEERCLVAPGVMAPTDAVFRDYEQWCKSGGLRSLGKIKFYNNIYQLCPAVVRRKAEFDGSRRWCFEGLGVVDSF